jgi:hypothetical protein
MSKRNQQAKLSANQPATTTADQPATTTADQPVVQPAAPAPAPKLTRRSALLASTVFVRGTAADRTRSSKNDHVAVAWQAVLAALPATAEQLCKLPELNQHPFGGTAQSYLTYWARRGYLAVQA